MSVHVSTPVLAGGDTRTITKFQRESLGALIDGLADDSSRFATAEV
ncbi:hypothetical protein [Streptomyces sp.]|jgi:hypothetical protein